MGVTGQFKGFSVTRDDRSSASCSHGCDPRQLTVCPGQLQKWSVTMTKCLPHHLASARADAASARDIVPLGHATRARDFCRWLEEEGDNLIAAVLLLGGPGWAKRAAGVVAAAREGDPLTTSCNTIKALSCLLHGSHAGDMESFGAWPYTWLHPDDPRATNAMRCADALDSGLRAINALRASRSGSTPGRPQ
jgi:hypothetical protein